MITTFSKKFTKALGEERNRIANQKEVIICIKFDIVSKNAMMNKINNYYNEEEHIIIGKYVMNQIRMNYLDEERLVREINSANSEINSNKLHLENCEKQLKIIRGD